MTAAFTRLDLGAFCTDPRLTPTEGGHTYTGDDGRIYHLRWNDNARQWWFVDGDTVLRAGGEADGVLHDAIGDPQPLPLTPLHAHVVALAGIHGLNPDFSAAEAATVDALTAWGLLIAGEYGFVLTDAGTEVADMLRQQRDRGEWQ